MEGSKIRLIQFGNYVTRGIMCNEWTLGRGCIRGVAETRAPDVKYWDKSPPPDTPKILYTGIYIYRLYSATQGEKR